MSLEIIVFCEGQTEEQFIKRVVAPTFRHSSIYLKPLTLKTSKDASGGDVSFDRLKINARNTLRQYPNAFLTTFLDLYKLNTDFPNYDLSKTRTGVYNKLECLEFALHTAIVSHVGCRPERFIPYIQPYEFEGLLFSDVSALVSVEPAWQSSAAILFKIRQQAETPEHINDGFETKPSSQLEKTLNPKFRKKLHGSLAAEKITLSVIENECKHFSEWMAKLRNLTC